MESASGNASQALASIIMPCWNSGKYLMESVRSALAQTYAPLELVVADDGSDDEETLRLLDALEASGDARIRVIRKTHSGLPATRNAAIRAARGTYILPLDSDDLIEPPYLAEAIDILAHDPDVGMVYARADLFDAQTGPWELGDFSVGRILNHNMIYASAVFRKADFEAVGGYEASLPFFEDWDFWLSFLELGRHPVRLGGTYFHYRKRADSSSMMHQVYCIPEVAEVFHTIMVRHLPLYQAHLCEFSDLMRVQSMEQNQRISQQDQALRAARQWSRRSEQNRWILLGQQMPWAELERRFRALFPELGGTRHPVQLAVGTVLAQAQMGVSDEEMMHQLAENPYVREFTGLAADGIVSFPPGFLDYVHGKLTEPVMREIAAMIP